MRLELNRLGHRIGFVALWTGVLYIGYLLTNHFQWFTPHNLPMTAVDEAIPFWPWTVIPYLFLILGMYLFAFIDRRDDFFAALLALTIAVSINYSIYLFYPTVYPRPPLPTASGWVYDVYRWLVGIDSPANCLPSGHITTPAIGCWYLARHRPQLRWPLLALFTALALTTLTTKQHYVIDIPAGLLTAAIGVVLAERVVRSNWRNWSRLYSYWGTS